MRQSALNLNEDPLVNHFINNWLEEVYTKPLVTRGGIMEDDSGKVIWYYVSSRYGNTSSRASSQENTWTWRTKRGVTFCVYLRSKEQNKFQREGTQSWKKKNKMKTIAVVFGGPFSRIHLCSGCQGHETENESWGMWCQSMQCPDHQKERNPAESLG